MGVTYETTGNPGKRRVQKKHCIYDIDLLESLQALLGCKEISQQVQSTVNFLVLYVLCYLALSTQGSN